MSYANLIIGILLLVNGSAFAVNADPYPRPSAALLSVADVSTFRFEPEIRISIGTPQKALDNKEIASCVNDSVVPLAALIGRIKNVTSVKAAIETSDFRSQKLLFELMDRGGLRKHGSYVSVHLDLKSHNNRLSNIWVFFTTPSGVFGKVAQIQCNIIHDSFEK